MHQLTFERLVQLLEAAPSDARAMDIVELWFHEHSIAKAEHDARMKQAAIDNSETYGIKRVEQGSMVAANGQEFPVLRTVEVIRVEKNDLGRFSKVNRIRYEDLEDLISGRRRDIVSTTGVWMSFEARWSNSRAWIDRSIQKEYQDMLRQEDEHAERFIQDFNSKKQGMYRAEEMFPKAVNFKGGN